MPVVGRGRPTPAEQDLLDQIRQLQSFMGQSGVPLEALPVPAYMLNHLPDATKWNNAMVRIIDNPQGTATSNGLVWLSDVDGSNLGSGNG